MLAIIRGDSYKFFTWSVDAINTIVCLFWELKYSYTKKVLKVFLKKWNW